MEWYKCADRKPPIGEYVIGVNINRFSNAPWAFSQCFVTRQERPDYWVPNVKPEYWATIQLPELPQSTERERSERFSREDDRLRNAIQVFQQQRDALRR